MHARLNLAFFLRSEESSGKLQLAEREDMVDEEDLFGAIHKRINAAGDVKKLHDAGIFTFNGLMMHTKKNLTGIKGLFDAKVDKICEAADKLENSGYITGSDALLKRKSVVHITTGNQALDELLGGGIEILSITEVLGDFRSGKTQVAHTLFVSTQLPTNMKGGNGKVAYIDTEGTFGGPDQIVAIAERFGMDPGSVLENIINACAYTYEHQYNLLLGLAEKMAKESSRLLIVDSAIALFRVDSTGRGELSERQKKLPQMLSRLTKIAGEFNAAVYMTNQVIADPGGYPKKPAGGHVLPQAATIRPMRKGKGEQRACKVFDAPNLQEAETVFQRTPEITTKSRALLLYFFVIILSSLMGTTRAFHHYTYAQTWAATSCYWKPCRYDSAQPENRFVLHGLWPSSEHSPNWFVQCDHPHGQNLFMEPYPLVNGVLLMNMAYYWPGLRMIYRVFWDYQWRRHGTCSPFDKTTYASYAIQVHSSVNIFNAMRNGGIHPIHHLVIPYEFHSRRRLKIIIAEHFPQIGIAEPELVCKGFRELEEIRHCISRVTGNFIDCTNKGTCKNWFRFVTYGPIPKMLQLQNSYKTVISSARLEQDNQAAQKWSKRRKTDTDVTKVSSRGMNTSIIAELVKLYKSDYNGVNCPNHAGIQVEHDFTAGVQSMTNNLSAPWEFNLEPVIPMYNAKPGQVEKALKHAYQVPTKNTRGKEWEPDNKCSLYGDLKHICETDLGIISQGCLTKPVFEITKQYLANVSMKIDAKTGGRKTVLLDGVSYIIPLDSDIPTIIFGADVSHPENGEDTSPSITASSIDLSF